jgi:glucose-1-phosphate thymidylyltransferase
MYPSQFSMKGIILAGGSGTRLYPVTQAVSKQLLPIADKPMIYYPLATLLQAGIREILLISTPHDIALYERLLGDGSWFGATLTYKIQEKPNGLAQAFILADEAGFLQGEPVCLVLGDNVFYGESIVQEARAAAALSEGGVIFGYPVADPERYGVVEFDQEGKVLSIEEKPKVPKSHYAIPGLYFFDGNVLKAAQAAKPSARGEYEITEIHNYYLNKGSLTVKLLSRGVAWLDTGTYASMLDASNFITAVQQRQGLQVGCLEEIAFSSGWITAEQVRSRGQLMEKTEYGQYLLRLADDGATQLPG